MVGARAATLAGAAAAAFPDADYVLNAFGQFTYLEYHQATTHSLPMLPLWALLLAMLCAWVYDRRSWRRPGGRLRLTLEFVPVVLTGLVLHTVGDLCNIWGLKLWWPFSDARVALGAVFVIDPLYTALVVAGLVASFAWRVRAGAAAGLGLVAGYTVVALAVHAHALRAAEALPAADGADEVWQFAAPPSLTHRRIVYRDADGWRYAFVDLRAAQPARDGDGWWARFTGAFRPLDDARFIAALHPDDAGGFAADAWRQPALEPFREFAELPYVNAVERDAGAVCAWFGDLRFELPEVDAPFIWGACRTANGSWEVRQRGRW